ncbi:MAG: hypothetical protein [Microviridae sp. ctbuH30]|nr:MAG: hypothetical protein [Microviridae sp. ctbuH30]
MKKYNIELKGYEKQKLTYVLARIIHELEIRGDYPLKRQDLSILKIIFLKLTQPPVRPRKTDSK